MLDQLLNFSVQEPCSCQQSVKTGKITAFYDDCFAKRPSHATIIDMPMLTQYPADVPVFMPRKSTTVLLDEPYAGQLGKTPQKLQRIHVK
jgi:hypothetical protein